MWSVNVSSRKSQCKEPGPAFVLRPWSNVHLESKNDVLPRKVTACPGCSGASGEGGGQIASTSRPANSQKRDTPPLPHRGCARGCSEGNAGAGSHVRGQGKTWPPWQRWWLFWTSQPLLLGFCSGAGISLQLPSAFEDVPKIGWFGCFPQLSCFSIIFF